MGNMAATHEVVQNLMIDKNYKSDRVYDDS
jgi:hypothetical protein